MYILNHFLCMSTITGIINNTLKADHFLPEFSVSFDANFSKEWSDLQCIYEDFDMKDLLAPVSKKN